ncbi:MAG: IclR family transcriptional regulator domain-containing protein, partial [Ramlibacter sp.]
MSIAKADFIEGMAKGMAVLESFDTERQRLNATLAAQRAGITRAAARRHLLTLAHLGYLETDGSYFWLSPKVLRFSGSYLASARLPRVLQPTLNRLAAQTAESFSAVVLDGDQVVIVARSGPTRLLAYGLHLGARLPAHATSTGRVLLAAKTKAEFNAWMKGRELARLTAHTTVDPRKFRALIEEVRAQDFCIASEEHELGVHALAVPLRNLQGQTV